MKTLLSLTLLAGSIASLSAQQYSINWSKIAGGGGLNSTGGVFSLSGTLGQPDAGSALTGGVYSVTGGFWPGVTLVQTPEAPLLGVENLGGNVRVYWPLPAMGFVLDEAASLATPSATNSWSQVSFPYQTNATHISVTVPASGNKFYRLRKS